MPDPAPDLATDYLGLRLRSPLVASASPLTGSIEGLLRVAAAGAAAVVLPSLFAEELAYESMEIDRLLSTGAESHAEAASYFPELEDYATGPGRHVDLVAKAKRALSVPVVASINGDEPGAWIEYAAQLEAAGADAIELNVYQLAADPNEPGEAVERRCIDLVAAVRRRVTVPLAVKIGPYFSSLGNLARALVAEGADGLVLFNRFYQPDFDLETLAVVPRLVLSTSDELRLRVRWVALLRGQLAASLAVTGGVHTTEDALKALLAGADAVMLTSALLRNGAGHLGKIERGISQWLDERGYASVDQLRGSASREAVPNPSAFERANYLRELASYSSRFRP